MGPRDRTRGEPPGAPRPAAAPPRRALTPGQSLTPTPSHSLTRASATCFRPLRRESTAAHT
ncbi:hypothetical protein ADL02_12035 [Streptomyces sp. NRRL WC-3723]|nr:hypothetical protein ADL02_12035 [Streptomyces sp. NRRL WC-3723]